MDVIVGIKKNANVEPCPIEFSVGEKIVTKREIFSAVATQIQNLEIDTTLTIKYKPEYNLVISDFTNKIRNMVFGHSRKFVEKRFSTSTLDSETIIVTRHTNRIF